MSPPSIRAESVSFQTGSLIIPMDTAASGQDFGMLRAYGLVYTLLRHRIPVHWVIAPGKAADGIDFVPDTHPENALEDVRGGGPIPASRAYRGGPFVIAAEDAVAAEPIIHAWQSHPDDVTVVHRLTAGSFPADVARVLRSAPRIAVLKDGFESVAANNLNAAGIPDSSGRPWVVLSSADVLTEQGVAGPTTEVVTDGMLFNAGQPNYGWLAAMHYISTGLTPHVVSEVRSWLSSGTDTHAFMQCESLQVFEDSPNGFFASYNGVIDDGDVIGDSVNRAPDHPLTQLHGIFQADSGAVDSFKALPGGFKPGFATLINENGADLSERIVLLSGQLDGNAACGRVTYFAGHDYTFYLPVSANPQTNGIRIFLNALLATEAATHVTGQELEVSLSAPASANTSSYTCTLTCTNTGAETAENVRLSYPLPHGVNLVCASNGGAQSADAVRWPPVTLAPGAVIQQNVTVSAIADGTFPNLARVDYGTLTLMSENSETLDTLIDTTAPEITFLSGPTAHTMDTTPTFTFSIDEPVVEVVAIIDGEPAGAAQSPFTTPPLAEGPHTLEIQATDELGNTGGSSRQFIIGGTQPSISDLVITPDSFQFRLSGDIGNIYEIQTSPNLEDWSTWRTETNTEGSVLVIDTPLDPEGRRFYRARLAP